MLESIISIAAIVISVVALCINIALLLRDY